MNKKEIQIRRMRKYFIDAAAQIIEEAGIEHITIRKVADIAGYNSATLYNYFEELSHLVFFAAMKFLKPYTDEVGQLMQKGRNPIEQYLIAWECFCRHSFQRPHIFQAIFISDLGLHPERLLQDYYHVYQSDLLNIPEEIKPLLFEHDMAVRGKGLLEKAADERLIEREKIQTINELTLFIWQGAFTTFLHHRRECDPEKMSAKTMGYIRQIVLHHDQFRSQDVYET